MFKGKKVSIIGSGNWGSAIARIIGSNVLTSDEFDDHVSMYVYEEVIDGKKLTEIINTLHENIKYLKGFKIPPNVVAIADVVKAAAGADILIFVLPHQFVPRICASLRNKIKDTTIAMSLIKGFETRDCGGIELISHTISRELNIPCYVMMGANLAIQIAKGELSEATIGCADSNIGNLLKRLVQTKYFKIQVVKDANTVEVCGALKNIVACGAGFIDGLSLGDNTKCVIIRLGLLEMIRFVKVFYPGSELSTFFESCGVADLIVTCYGGRNRKCCAAFAETKKSLDEIEKEFLNGQKLQGPITAAEVNHMLKSNKLEEKFPVFTAIHKICTKQMPVEEFVDYIIDKVEQ